MIVQITEETVQTLIAHKLSIHDLVILHCIQNNLQWHEELRLGVTASIKKLKSRKLLNNDLKLTQQGLDILGNKQPDEPEVVQELQIVTSEIDIKFEEFWKTYPASDKFGNWPRTRVLRNDRVTAKRRFASIILTEGISGDTLIQCLQEDVKLMKKNSVRENKLSYMPRICTWLNKRIYEGFLEDVQNSNTNTNTTPKYGEELD